MESVTPEKQAEHEREFRDAFNDLEPLIRSMIQGANAVFTIAEGIATAGDDMCRTHAAKVLTRQRKSVRHGWQTMRPGKSSPVARQFLSVIR